MSDIPCNHEPDAWVGTVSSGKLDAGPHCSVVTCQECVLKSAGYVQMKTGIPANPFMSFAEVRSRR